MFAHLCSRKVGAELREVTFRSGDWAGSYDGPLRLGGFLDGQQEGVTCKIDAGEYVCEATVVREWP